MPESAAAETLRTVKVQPVEVTEVRQADASSPVQSDARVSDAEVEARPDTVASGEQQAAADAPAQVNADALETPMVEAQPSGVKAQAAGNVTGPEITEPAVELTAVQKLIAAGEFKAARDLALKDLREGNARNDSEFWAAVEADPLLTRTLDEEVRPHGTNSISALGGGSTVSFKYKDSADESAKAALKPDQDLRQTMYRSGIAYYRLCQILGCSFDTPVTRPVRFSKADFNTLYNASDSSKNRGYRSKFEHLIWATENGTKYMYAGYKEWISPFDGFPIEVTGVWSPYLKNPATNPPDVKPFLRSLLAGARPDAPKPVTKLVEFAGDMTTRDILHQISDIILVDYLTNNWDRFSGDVNNYGANCHFQPGGIIAIDNDAAFPPWHAPRVVRRLNLVQMFSRDLVANLRVLDPDKLLHHLFPDPTKEELKSFERFKERRIDALKYIDGLIDKKGEDKVLVF